MGRELFGFDILLGEVTKRLNKKLLMLRIEQNMVRKDDSSYCQQGSLNKKKQTTLTVP